MSFRISYTCLLNEMQIFMQIYYYHYKHILSDSCTMSCITMSLLLCVYNNIMHNIIIIIVNVITSQQL